MQLITEVMLAKIKEPQWALADIDRDAPGAHWNSDCKSWHLTEDGFNSTMYPGFAT